MTEFPFKHLLQNNVNNYKDSIKINLGQPLLQQSVNHLLTSFEENMGLHQEFALENQFVYISTIIKKSSHYYILRTPIENAQDLKNLLEKHEPLLTVSIMKRFVFKTVPFYT